VHDTGAVGSALSRGVVIGIAALTFMLGTGNSTVNATSARSSDLKVALIGDSIAVHLASDLRNSTIGGPHGVTWEISAQPGAGWGEGEDAHGNWPLDVVQGHTMAQRVRAAARGRPSVIVLELGTNDALRASFAYALNNGVQLKARIDGTDNDIRNVVKLASSLSPCVVLVSPSYYPTAVFGAEGYYSAMALQIRTVLMKEESRAAHHRVVLADWAAVSSTHLDAVGSSGDWFTSDGLHPDANGLAALANLIIRTAKTCRL
jgi:lysophospholipase L1-like esterase